METLIDYASAAIRATPVPNAALNELEGLIAAGSLPEVNQWFRRNIPFLNINLFQPLLQVIISEPVDILAVSGYIYVVTAADPPRWWVVNVHNPGNMLKGERVEPGNANPGWLIAPALATTPAYQDYLYQRMLEKQRYSCGVNGTCQLASSGTTLSECERTCRPEKAVSNDALYSVYAYDPISALQLPFADQRRVLTEILGYTVPDTLVILALTAIANDDWGLLRKLPALDAYLVGTYSPMGIFLRDVTIVLGLRVRRFDYADMEAELEMRLTTTAPAQAVWLLFYNQLPSSGYGSEYYQLIESHLNLLQRRR